MATQTASTKIAAPNRLKGQVAIVTGGDQGDGQAIALRLAADGPNCSPKASPCPFLPFPL